MKRPEVAIIAGGVGSRVHDLSRGKPKCLLPVNGSTILDLQLDFFARNNFRRIHLFLGFGAEQVLQHLKERSDMEFVFHIESQPKGSAGELVTKLIQINENLVVVHGDLYLDFPIQNMIEEIDDSTVSFVQLVHPSNHMRDSDIVETDQTGVILSIKNKPHTKDLVSRNQCNAGVFVFSKNWIQQIVDYTSRLGQTRIDLDRELIPNLLANGLKGRAHRNIGEVRDLGTPERLLNFHPTFRPEAKSYLKPMIFLDRDGVINKNYGWISRVADFKVYEDVTQAIGLLNNSGFRISVITNQPVVARGEATLSEINKMHSVLDMKLTEQNAYIDEYFICPHHPDSGFAGEIPELKINCNCRKPGVGLLEIAIKKFPTMMANSWMIGDTWRDKEAADRMNLKFIQINRDSDAIDSSSEFPMFKDLVRAVNYILKLSS